jgi:hypothetical protein
LERTPQGGGVVFDIDDLARIVFANDACQLWQADTEEDLCPGHDPTVAKRL